MLPETPVEGALIVARRLCERLAALPVASQKVTISIGVATGQGGDVLLRADAAMYRATRSGKNRACPWESG
jgi:PleD family two-component response regulator